ncbi:outer membrane protein assembly factor BamB family protein, partial [Streptomyces beihaiensis]|uniref:outer membrane protein assembly factor BamB family protein n=1 Tax=Streptomyces beihaiensis TaxID=2984495 RepID=UPI003899A7C3
GGGGWRGAPAPSAASAAPAASAVATGPGPGVGLPADGPVRLAGARVPIGPGPRVADARAAAVQAPPPESGLAATWSRAKPTAPSAAPDPAAPAPAGTDAAAWRPWRFRMSNDVWGTPTVSGDLVYVTSFEVHALDVSTGRRRFKTRDVAWSMAVADGRIHASDGPTLWALDAREGTDLWRIATDAWVYALDADRGTVVTGTRGGGVQAREAVSGDLLWEITGCQSDFESPESGPVVHDGTVYVWQDARLRALEARTGEERWSYPIGDAASCGGVPVRLTPAADGYVYVSAGTRVLAVEVGSGRVRWHFEAPAVFLCPPTYVPGPAVTGGGVYLVDHLGTVYALDATDGRDRWRIATESRSSSVAPVLVAQGHVHVGSGQGLYTLDAVTGTPKWRFQAGGEIVGSPVVADGRVHFGSADHLLYTLKADDGRLRWKLATGGEITGTPVVRDGVVYACSKDRCVYALDAERGTGTSRQGR